MHPRTSEPSNPRTHVSRGSRAFWKINLAVFSAGAYGMVMASNYNTRPRAAEVLVDGARARLVRRRETYEDLLGPERLAI